MQAYEANNKEYLPASPSIGMHVDIVDPDKKVVLSRVSWCQCGNDLNLT